MIVVHKKNKGQHEITREQWEDMKKKGWNRYYNVIDNSELIVKEIKMPETHVKPTNLEVEELKEWLKERNIPFDKRIKDIKKLQKLIP